MCPRCDDPTHVIAVPRRTFVLGAGVAMAGLVMSSRGFAQAAKTPPKKENVLSPEESLKRLWTEWTLCGRGGQAPRFQGRA